MDKKRHDRDFDGYSPESCKKQYAYNYNERSRSRRKTRGGEELSPEEFLTKNRIYVTPYHTDTSGFATGRVSSEVAQYIHREKKCIKKSNHRHRKKRSLSLKIKLKNPESNNNNNQIHCPPSVPPRKQKERVRTGPCYREGYVYEPEERKTLDEEDSCSLSSFKKEQKIMQSKERNFRDNGEGGGGYYNPEKFQNEKAPSDCINYIANHCKEDKQQKQQQICQLRRKQDDKFKETENENKNERIERGYEVYKIAPEIKEKGKVVGGIGKRGEEFSYECIRNERERVKEDEKLIKYEKNKYAEEFSFEKTESGNLKVDPKLLIYESKRFGVLVKDPYKTRTFIKVNDTNSSDNMDDNNEKKDQKKINKIPPPVPPPPPPPPHSQPETEYSIISENENDSAGRESGRKMKEGSEVEGGTLGTCFCPKCGCGSIKSELEMKDENDESENTKSYIYEKERFAEEEEEEGYDENVDEDEEDSGLDKNQAEFLEHIHYRLKRAINADMKVIIGESEFPVHSIALGTYSKKIDRLKRPNEMIYKLDLTDQNVSPAEFPNLMDWILMGKNDKKFIFTTDNVIGLYSLGKILEIPLLKEECLRFIKRKVEKDDPRIIRMFEEASKKNLKELTNILSSQLALLFPSLYKSKRFLKMEFSQLKTLLDSDNLRIKSEIDVYDTAVRWLLFDWKYRNKYTSRMMETVRFGLLTSLQLTQIQHCSEASTLPDYNKIFDFPDVKQMVEKGLKYSIYKENYGDRPGELNRWLKDSNVKAPKPRFNLDHNPDTNRLPYCSIENDEEEGNYYGVNAVTSGENKIVPNKPKNRANLELDLEKGGDYEVNEYKNQIKAAVTIQRNVRGYMQRKKFEEMKKRRSSSELFHENKRLKNLVIFGGYDPSTISDKNNKNKIEESSQSFYQYEEDGNYWMHFSHLPEPRIRLGVVQIRDLVYIFGGANPNSVTKEGKYPPTGSTWSLQVKSLKWSQLADMQVPRDNFGFAEFNERIFVFGGIDSNGKTQSSCEMYNPDINSWTFISPMISPRAGVAVGILKDKIWVAGGLVKIKKEKESSSVLNTVIVYNPKNNRWNEEAPLPIPICYSKLLNVNENLYLVGGLGKFQQNNKKTHLQSLSEIFTFEVNGNSWVKVGDLEDACHGHGGIVTGNYIIVLGGINSIQKSTLNSVQIFNVKKRKVSKRILFANLPYKITGLASIIIR